MSDEIPDPRQLPIPRQPEVEKISDAEMEEAARHLGLVRMAPRTVKALQKVARYIEENGICYVQAAEVMKTRSQLEDLYEKCLRMVDEIDDPEIRVDAMKAATAIAREKNLSNAMIQKMLDAKMLGPDKPAKRYPGLAPGQAVGLTQVNITSPEKVEINSKPEA